MAEDLARYLAGEAPLAMPTSYARLTSGKIDRHLKELEAWKQDELLSDEEYRAFRTSYGRLIDREDAWIMEARRLTVSQVSLYLGAWLTVIGAALLVLFNYADLQGALKVGVAVAATVPMAWLGIRWWTKRLLRVGMAFLLAFCLLMPITLLVGMGEFNILAQVPDENLELLSEEFLPEGYRAIRNAQLFWAILLSLPVYLWLRRFTRSSVFMFSTAIAGALLAIVTLLRMGLLQWIMDERYTYAYFQLIPVALMFFAIGIAIEKWGYSEDSRPFYPIAVAFTWIGLSGMAYTHQGYLDFVGDDSEYLYLINAGIYFVLQSVCEALPWSRLQSVGRAFRLVIPGHVLVSIWSLGNHAMNQWKGPEGEVLDLAYRFEARFFEVLLPCLACAFVYLSIPRQMKNFFVWGMVFLAIGVVNLQNDIFANRRAWLICLMLGGLAIMFLSTHYSDLRLVLSRRFSSHRKK
jgi:hypothetical protein